MPNNPASQPRLLATFIALALTTSGAMYAVSSRAQNTVLEEIVVTARKREENLQETPISITAFNADSLRLRSLDQLSDIGKAVPNLVFDTAGNSAATSSLSQVFIRGIGQNDFLPTADPGVGIYFDDVYLGRTAGGIVGLKDIESIQVLRGPQGTLFGRNTIGGAILISSVRPGDEFGGFAEATVGKDGWYEFDGAINIPVSDQVALRFSGNHTQHDGYFDSSSRPDLDFGDEDNYTLVGQLNWKGDHSNLLLRADYFELDQEAAPTVLVDAELDSPSLLTTLYNTFAGPLYGELPLTEASIVDRDDPYDGSTGGPSSDEGDVYGVSLTWDWDAFSWGSLRSITAYREIDTQFASDNDGAFHTLASTADDFEQKQFSQELQLLYDSEKFSAVAGLYYFEETASDDNLLSIIPGLYDFLGVPGLDFEQNPSQVMEVTNYAIFGQGTWRFTEQLSITAGLRWTDEEKEYTYSLFKPAQGVFSVPETTKKGSWDEVTPRFGVEYITSNDTLLYASYARGFKSGTFNGRAGQQQAIDSVDPETVDTYEVGFKAEPWDGRARINLALYYSDYQDIQLVGTRPDLVEGLVISLINAGEAEVYGGELEVTVKPTDRLDFILGLGYAHSEIDGVDPQDALETGVQNGSELAKTPQWAANAGIQFTQPLDLGELILRLDYYWKDDMYHQASNTPTTLEDSYGTLDGRFSLYMASGWELAVFGVNLTDETTYSTLFRNAGEQTTGIANRPRTLGVNIAKRF